VGTAVEEGRKLLKRCCRHWEAERSIRGDWRGEDARQGETDPGERWGGEYILSKPGEGV